ncbi:AmmeMemoRadiSam system protein B [Thalassovita sp.]|uniref:AmmeMemoRadiSam system protein B n=1 Tax=Thalassovita sp. TaxID=1979401 RepID=UPI0029DE8D77|nr:AmmeMemoRadiSam system protein B [Thalassovita sp.]
MIRLLLLVYMVLFGAARADCPDGDFPPFYKDTGLFDAGLAGSRHVQPVRGITGAILPHHLEMPELLGGAVRMVAGTGVKRLVLLFPDHFYKSRTPFATTPRGFQTVLGPVPVDADAAGALIGDGLVEESCLFQREHGVRAALPFIARLMPGVQVVPVAVSINSVRADWDAMLERLRPLMGPDTAVLQITDFSHYLPLHGARLRDQQVLNVLAANDIEAAARLVQPDHVDSVGSMYIAMTLMAERGARPVVVANANMQSLYDHFIAETTSYVVAAFVPEEVDPAPFAAERFLIGGDLFLGRVLPGLLTDELIARRVEEAALSATRGLPLVLNLEGVLLPQMPSTLDHMVLGMPADIVRDWAERLNIVAVSLANNHARDIGESGLSETRAALNRFGIAHFAQGEVLRLKGAVLVGLTDLDGRAVPPVGRLTPDLLDRAVLPDAETPVIALVHWGREFVTQPSAREAWIAEELRKRGVVGVIGAHPHAVSAAPVVLAGGETIVVQSLGNFLFDQLPPDSSGGLAEVRVFSQGTVFIRQLPLPHLFAATQPGH